MGPNFIGLGAQRSGSTWLHRTLTNHPQLWMTPIKEIHYFDDPQRSRYFKDLDKRWKRSKLMTKWDLKYFLGPAGDKWYTSLFSDAQKRDLIAGEITPDYAVLDDATFAKLYRMNPEMKFIFMMRDPIERSWSHYCNAKRKGQADSSGSLLESALRFCTLPDIMLYSDYMRTINTVERHFPKNQIFYGFFEDIKHESDLLIKNLLEFLGVDVIEAAALKPSGRVNTVVGDEKIPDDFIRLIAPHLLPLVDSLTERFNTHPATWRKRIQSAISDDTSIIK